MPWSGASSTRIRFCLKTNIFLSFFKKNPRPHVTILNRFSPSTLKRNGSWKRLLENWTIFDLSMRIYLYLSPWRNRIQKPLISFIHSCTAKRHFQKSPLWRAFLKRCVFGDRFHRIRVDVRTNRRKTSPFSNRNEYVWKMPVLRRGIYFPLTLYGLLSHLCFVLNLSVKSWLLKILNYFIIYFNRAREKFSFFLLRLISTDAFLATHVNARKFESRKWNRCKTKSAELKRVVEWGSAFMLTSGLWCIASIFMSTQREYSSKPLEHSIVKRILVFKR